MKFLHAVVLLTCLDVKVPRLRQINSVNLYFLALYSSCATPALRHSSPCHQKPQAPASFAPRLQLLILAKAFTGPSQLADHLLGQPLHQLKGFSLTPAVGSLIVVSAKDETWQRHILAG